ncbi:MAG: bifunctional diaminohydroxyphosphoribosylaminopyrimidine deaminase/5-amino-6-(5-phosphoribosylamino)uracil reductase RibD [Nitrospinae bacterium]|nr:bifunctional diaminohydroxyphosphoribosylaminopyrimidine deaminase/5-amino-6-(5-phosphoribosylamino)uracil reductase RibD [Nitrospinota bacterium]
MTNKENNRYMRQAIKLAYKGMGYTSPNPPVGAVIVKGNKIIGKGYHQKSGEPHAEIHAINNCTESPKGAELYVTLEPCNHTGKTGPCSEAIIKAGIIKVFIGSIDPNPDVKGSGTVFLEENNIKVVSGILKKECDELIKYFSCFIQKKRPYFIYKSAASIDGKTATATGKSQWITSEKSRIDGHKLRNQVDAILVGKQTFLLDNPQLTTRLTGKRTRNPVRIILNANLSFPKNCTLERIKPLNETIFIYSEKKTTKKDVAAVKNKGFEVFSCETNNKGQFNLKKLCHYLYTKNIASVLIEGGGNTVWNFFNQKLIDEQILYLSPKIIAGKNARGIIDGEGFEDLVNTPVLSEVNIIKLAPDLKITGKIVYQNGNK